MAISPQDLFQQLPLKLAPDRPLSFETFVLSPSNEAIVARIRDFTAWPSPIFALFGPHGCGKTHIGTAWAAEHPEAVFIDNAEGYEEIELFSHINRALTGQVQALLMSARKHPWLWEVALPDLRSRLDNTPAFELPEADDQLLGDIVRGLFASHGRQVSRDLVDYMISRSERTVSALERHVAALEAQAQRDKSDISKAYAARHMQA
jgi:chromosomal replication initiation ATPase DnaA